MAEVQTTYGSDLPVGFAGMVANGETSNRISRTVEDAAGIGFGKAVFRGALENGCTATPTAGQFLGITIAHSALPYVAGQTVDVYPRYEAANILSHGAIFVTAGEDVTAGAQAYATAGGAIVDTVGTNVILPGFFFDHAALNGGLVRLVKR